MADYLDHIHQAEHNEKFGEHLLSQLPQFRDWLITVSFYAAIHYVEASFAQKPDIGHTETRAPEEVSQHQFRQEMVRREFGNECWKSYRKLRDASRNVRYLVLGLKGKPGIATDYYNLGDAGNFFRNDLRVVKRATGN